MQKVFEQIKDALVKGLKEKGLSWFKPWNTGQAAARPINWATGKAYNGINIFMLNAAMIDGEYSHNEWLTFKQCAANGGKVNKGSKSSNAYFWEVGVWNPDTKKKYRTLAQALDSGEDQDNLKKYIILKMYKVFNVSQTDLVPKGKVDEMPKENEFTPIESAEEIASNYLAHKNIPLHHRGNKAYYSPIADEIVMPKQEAFMDADSYYKTLFHEMAHSTGHSDRLNRFTTENYKFGSDAYSLEELVAESSALVISGIAGINPHMDNSKAYVNGWIKGVQSTPAKALATALQRASKAVDMIIES